MPPTTLVNSLLSCTNKIDIAGATIKFGLLALLIPNALPAIRRNIEDSRTGEFDRDLGSGSSRGRRFKGVCTMRGTRGKLWRTRVWFRVTSGLRNRPDPDGAVFRFEFFWPFFCFVFKFSVPRVRRIWPSRWANIQFSPCTVVLGTGGDPLGSAKASVALQKLPPGTTRDWVDQSLRYCLPELSAIRWKSKETSNRGFVMGISPLNVDRRTISSRGQGNSLLWGNNMWVMCVCVGLAFWDRPRLGPPVDQPLHRGSSEHKSFLFDTNSLTKTFKNYPL